MALALAAPAETLRSLVGLVLKVVERRNTIPILSNVVIRGAADGSLAVTATDLDIWATARAPEGAASVEQAGAVTLPAHLLADLLRKLPKTAEIRIAVKDDSAQAVVTSGLSTVRLVHLPEGDFPAEPPFPENATVFDMTPFQLKRIEREVGFAISTEETRYYLNGICLHGSAAAPAHLTAVATDGHRLSLLRLAIEGDASGLPRIIVPRKTIALLPGLADTVEEGEAVRIAATDSRIRIETKRLSFVSKLIDGTFPEYERVIPRGNSHTARLDPAALAGAADRVSTISTERGRGVRFAFDGQGALTLVVNAPDAGEAREEIACQGGPEAMEIGFNAKYVADALATFGPAPIDLSVQDPGSPALLRHPGDEDRLVVLMPMRI